MLKLIKFVIEFFRAVTVGINIIMRPIINFSFNLDFNWHKLKFIVKFRELEYLVLCFQKQFIIVIAEEVNDVKRTNVILMAKFNQFNFIWEFAVGS